MDGEKADMSLLPERKSLVGLLAIDMLLLRSKKQSH